MKTKLEFSEDFFDSEERNEYHITSNMKKIWAIEMDLLNEFLSVCKKHDIRAIVYAGTLLGAIRHKGFIPWDDDIDVALLRSDYEKLLSVAEQEFNYPYFFQTALNDRRFFCGSARLRNSETTGLITYNESVNYNNGIYIDVFVLDGLTDDIKKLEHQLKDRNKCINLIRLLAKQRLFSNKTKKFSGNVVSKVLKFFTTYEKLYDKYSNVLQRYNSSNEVSLITAPLDLALRYKCNVKDFDDIIWVPFEFIKVPVPKNYDKILTNIYGNYMDFPSLQERGKWHSEVLIIDPDISYKEFIRKRGKNND